MTQICSPALIRGGAEAHLGALSTSMKALNEELAAIFEEPMDYLAKNFFSLSG